MIWIAHPNLDLYMYYIDNFCIINGLFEHSNDVFIQANSEFEFKDLIWICPVSMSIFSL